MQRSFRSLGWVAAAGLMLTVACGPKLANTPESQAALEQRPALPGYNLDRSGVAIEGYDPVAYFPEGGGKPTKGNPAIAESYQGVVYQFANEDNRQRFVDNPGRYEPAYGGWCAYAMAKGMKVKIDPEAYIIQEDRLLLFFKMGGADTREKWQQKPESMLVDADINWRDTSGECPQSRRAAAMSSSEGTEATAPDGAPSSEEEPTAGESNPGESAAPSPPAEAQEAAPDGSGDESSPPVGGSEQTAPDATPQPAASAPAPTPATANNPGKQPGKPHKKEEQ